MNRKINLFCLLASLFCLGFCPSARAYHNGVAAISASIIQQITNEKDVNHTRKVSWSTETLLQQLARDEHVAGLWDRDTFPLGSTLQFDGANFIVVSGTNNIAVSNVMTLTLNLAAQNQANVTTSYAAAIINFDDTAFTDELEFSVNAMATINTSYFDLGGAITGLGPPPKQTDVFTIQSGTGLGYNPAPFAIANFTLHIGPLVRFPINPDPGGGGFSLGDRYNPMRPRVSRGQ
jgi:hypothetical protein